MGFAPVLARIRIPYFWEGTGKFEIFGNKKFQIVTFLVKDNPSKIVKLCNTTKNLEDMGLSFVKNDQEKLQFM